MKKIISISGALLLLSLLSACGQDTTQSTMAEDMAKERAESISSDDATRTNGDANAENSEDKRPNIVFILADDLGYADLGAFGSEIPTPNLDELAHEGMMLTDFHTQMTCSPTRAMFMAGMDSHRAGLGVMGAPTREDQQGQPGYEGYLNFNIASLADLMSDAGYNTYMTGKWHIGYDEDNGPHARGFKHSFISLDGAAHLGGWDWRGPQPAGYRDDNELVQVGDDFYTTRFYTERMIEYIEQDRDEGKPFFAWLAYTAPHWPLQAPKESIARFRGQYDEGWEVLYERRFRNMQRLGLIPEDTGMPDESMWSQRWDDLSDEEKAYAARRMEIYAAMVSDLDTYIGEFLDYLESIGELDNTFIVFMSDNGAESTRRELVPPISDHIGKEYDHSLDNLGAANTYVMYGRDWATASTVASRRHKATAFEGGIRVPAFAWYPSMIEGGRHSDAFGTIMDLMPTFLELAETKHPGTHYRGEEVLQPQGRSLLPLLNGESARIHPEDTYVGWELFGHRGVRQGDWKIVWDAAVGDNAQWLLFNVEEDRLAQYNLAEEEPEKLAEMVELWDRYADENGVIY